MIETTTFRLAPGTDEVAFLEEDRRVQTSVFYQQPGFIRRTTARGPDGGWIIITLWRSEADADAVAADSAFTALLAGVETRRYTELD